MQLDRFLDQLKNTGADLDEIIMVSVDGAAPRIVKRITITTEDGEPITTFDLGGRIHSWCIRWLTSMDYVVLNVTTTE